MPPPPHGHSQPHYFAPPPHVMQRRFNPSPSRCLGVFGLSYHTSERALYRLFDKYGRVDRVKIVTDPRTSRSRGFAFVYFGRVQDAVAARERVHGLELDGASIRVEFSISNREHQPTPGVYMGSYRPQREFFMGETKPFFNFFYRQFKPNQIKEQIMFKILLFKNTCSVYTQMLTCLSILILNVFK